MADKGKSSDALAVTTFMADLLRSFIWMDQALQRNLVHQGWSRQSRTESQIMILVTIGINRPSEIAETLGVSRQAVNQSTKALIERNMIGHRSDPNDKRCKILVFGEASTDIRRDAAAALVKINEELANRIGPKALTALQQAVGKDWGEPPLFENGTARTTKR